MTADKGGLLLAAPASGSGKTVLTLALLRALARAGVPVRSAKSGPDYIDPAFHAAATGRACVNLDAWAMPADLLSVLAPGPGPLVVEGAMGLFDAAADGRGSAAQLARTLGLSVVLIVDAARMAQSVAPLVAGFARHDPALPLAGVILNRVGSPRHEGLLRAALEDVAPVLGAVPRSEALSRPSRHLGLVQAAEDPALPTFLDAAADLAERHLDLPTLTALAERQAPGGTSPIRPPTQSIAVARDEAFAFAYPHLLNGWRAAGASIHPFSPLADQPAPAADLVYLPGGYPELHAGRLAAATRFLASLQDRAVYGECGGYMALGDCLIDADGTRHAMAGLLRLETSFEAPRLHLGYRHLRATHGPFPGHWTGHEFHHATTLRAEGRALYAATDATGARLPPMGLVEGPVSGSFAHVIAPVAPGPPGA
ncbi:MAG: cobyrinate a,c-diamide synthase [Paracoccaceae bacterium]